MTYDKKWNYLVPFFILHPKETSRVEIKPYSFL